MPSSPDPSELSESDDTLPLPRRAGPDPGDAPTIQGPRGAESDEPDAAPTRGTDRISARQRTLGPYQLLAVIGRGGMGAVWEAIDTRLDRHVALKVMLAGSEATPESVERFRREALHAARLRHPNIVPVHDVGHVDGRHYLVMDLVEGESLDAALRHEGISYRDLATLLAKVARAVQYAHEQGVVHRDLKPQNIMIERRAGRATTSVAAASSSVSTSAAAMSSFGEPLVMDFGLAKDTEADSGLSRSGDVMGTPAYMPPEQAEGRIQEVGPRSDVYSLGAILYEMLTRRPPFVGENAVQVMKAVVLEDPVWPRRLAPTVPRDLETICLKCLEKRPERRYESAAALAADLDAWLAGDPIAARPIGTIERLLKRVRKDPAAYAVGAAAAVIIAAGSAGFMLSLDRKATEAVKALEDFRSAQQARERAEQETRALEDRRRAESLRSWQLVFSDDFSDAKVFERWQLMGTKCVVQGGELRFLSESPSFAVLKQPVVGDVAIEYDCRISGEALDDVSCFLRAVPPDPLLAAPQFNADTGYAFKYGCYRNTENRLMRDGKTLWREQASPLQADRAYHVRAEQIGGRLKLMIDGATVCDVQDPHPIEDGSRTALGLSCYWSKAAFDNVRVYIYGASLKEDLLDAAQRHLRSGHLVTAHDLFADVRDSSADPARREAAAAGAEHAKVALERLEQFTAVSRIIGDLNPRWKTAVSLGDDGVQVDLSFARPLDLAALAGLPIVSLHLSRTDVDDLAPLRGMPIEHLWIDHTRVTDLRPLAGLPLRTLDCSGLPLRSTADPGGGALEPLRGLRLEALTCEGDGIEDLSPLQGMPLTQLHCTGNAIASLEPLTGMPLDELACIRNRIVTVAPLRGMKLGVLKVGDNPVADLEPLRGMPLRVLDCQRTGVASLEPLSGMRLEQAWCGATRVTSLEPLRGMPLTNLDCGWIAIGNLDAVAGMRLTGLYCPGTGITSLEPLRGMPISFLRCGDNRISSLEPLRGMPLTGLDCSRNGLANLEGLQGTKIESLNAGGNAIESLEPLRGMRMDSVRIDRNRVSSLEPLFAAPPHLISCEGNPLATIGPFLAKPPVFLACDAAAVAGEDLGPLIAASRDMSSALSLGRRISWKRAMDDLSRGAADADAGRFDEAEAAGLRARSAGALLADDRLSSRVEAALVRWRSMRAMAESRRAADLALAKDPDDPAALRDSGRDLILRGHGDQAMPLLARSSDPALRSLAALEVAPDRSSSALAALALGWSEAALRETDEAMALVLADRAWQWRDAMARAPDPVDLEQPFARLAGAPWLPRLRVEWLDGPDAMSPYPTGFTNLWNLTPSSTDDPSGPFFGDAVQFNASTGSSIAYDIRCSFAATSITVSCMAIEGLTIEVRSDDGVTLATMAPITEGDVRDSFTLTFAPCSHLRVRIQDHPSFWFMVESIQVR